jgi:catechol 2,3-dioxygenase-like lactoylglutathione lyase family enzyme
MYQSRHSGETMANITGIDHVQVAMPVGAEDAARAFYSGVLGLTEVPKPAQLAVRGGAWFACGAAQLHLGADSAFQPAHKAHPALTVAGFDDFVAGVRGSGVAVRLEETVAGLQRATLNDPFGNKVELIEQR